MKKKLEENFILFMCAILTSLAVITGAAVAVMGAYTENLDVLYAGAHITVWPVVLFVVGAGIVETFKI